MLGSMNFSGDNGAMANPALKRPSLKPGNWGGWVAVMILWSVGKLPQRVGLALAAPLGWLMLHLMRRRVRIAQRNVDRCFPDLTVPQRKTIVADCFRSLARAVFEIAWSWSASEKFIESIGEIRGAENFFAVKQPGKGVVMLSPHVSCLEIGARIVLGNYHQVKGMYRPLKSPVLEWYQTRARGRHSEGMISKRDVRGAIRYLRQGGVLWYAPDQDFGPDQSEFVPFFGIQTATLMATHRIPKLAGCPVLLMFTSYDIKSRRYTVNILPALNDFPSEDPIRDLTRVNAALEQHIREYPGQYWWIHRRFKSRPQGEPPFYD